MPAPSNIVLTPTSGVAPFVVSISGTDLFERPGFTRKETFTLLAPDSVPAAWQGTDPTRVDGKIGKAIRTGATSLNYLDTYTYNSAADGNNNLWPNAGSATSVTGLFVSMWIKPAQLKHCGIFGSSCRDASNAFSNPYNIGTFSQIAVFLRSDGRIGFIINSTGSSTVKSVYTGPNVVSLDTWTHVLCQWSSVTPWVSVDAPKIYINGILQSVTIISNANFAGLTSYGTGGTTGGISRIGDGPYCSSTLNTTFGNWVASGSAFVGDICDVYVGNRALTEAEIMMYANLPKVELIKV